jgi:hypothetical protein
MKMHGPGNIKFKTEIPYLKQDSSGEGEEKKILL